LSAWRGSEGRWVVDQTWQYSAAEMERMMKVQDVLLKAMAKKITWWAGRLLGGQSRLKAGCGQNCPPSNPCRALAWA
jgi:hypothetical protein